MTLLAASQERRLLGPIVDTRPHAYWCEENPLLGPDEDRRVAILKRWGLSEALLEETNRELSANYWRHAYQYSPDYLLRGAAAILQDVGPKCNSWEAINLAEQLRRIGEYIMALREMREKANERIYYQCLASGWTRTVEQWRNAEKKWRRFMGNTILTLTLVVARPSAWRAYVLYAVWAVKARRESRKIRRRGYI